MNAIKSFLWDAAIPFTVVYVRLLARWLIWRQQEPIRREVLRRIRLRQKFETVTLNSVRLEIWSVKLLFAAKQKARPFDRA